MSEVRITHLLPGDLRLRRDMCALAWLPVGTIEWHGKHLPLGQDGLIAEEFCLRAARQIGGVVFPTVYYGDHRGITVEAIAAPGAWPAFCTLSFDHRVECGRELGVSVAGLAANAVRDHNRIGPQAEAYVELLERSYWMIRAYGFTRILVLQGHGGVVAPAQAAAERFNSKQSACRAISGFDAFIGDEIIGVAGATAGHAGAWETSLTMYVLPDLVELERLATDRPDEPTGVTPLGNDQLPERATQQRGRAVLEGFIARCRAELGEIPPSSPISNPDEDGVAGNWTELVRSDASLRNASIAGMTSQNA